LFCNIKDCSPRQGQEAAKSAKKRTGKYNKEYGKQRPARMHVR